MSKKVLSKEVKAALTVKAVEDFYIASDALSPKKLLQAAIESVLAIPAISMPAESSYHLVSAELVVMLRAVNKKHDKKTSANNITMFKNATIAELDRKAKAISADAIAAKAAKAAKAKPTKANTIRAEKAAHKAAALALIVAPTSLDKASKAGVQAARRKTSSIVVRQAAANKKGKTRKVKPTKLQAAAAAETRTAKKELFLTAVGHAKDTIALGDKAKAADVMTAFVALSAASIDIVDYLPADMRTL